MDIQSISERRCFSFTWAIENFSFCWKKTGEGLSSPTFIADTIERTKWKLVLYPDGNLSEKNGFMSFFLRREEDSKGSTDIVIFFELAFLAADGSVIKSSGIGEYSFVRGKEGGFTEILKKELFKSQRQQFLPDDILTARCRMWKKFGQITEEIQCFARTQIGVERRLFVWAIPKFNTFKESCFNIKSISNDTPVITLKLYHGRKGLINLLVLLKNRRIKCSVFHIKLLNASEHEVEYLKEKIIFNTYSESCLFKAIFPKKVFMENKQLYLPNDVLTLHCECSFTTGIVLEEIDKICCGYSHSTEEENLASDDLESTKKSLDLKRILQENLEFLYKENLLCDTKLKTKTGEFPAHKNILSARSPVFNAMFNNDMREKNSECVNIEDLDDDTVQTMLLYMYTATMPDLQWDRAYNLYVAADKYEILSLKSECSYFLKDNLSSDNACDLLILADMHLDEDLKSRTEEFILNHRGIFNTNEWKLFMKNNAQIAAELLYRTVKE
ncbi:TD and POZ domain-containing protein 1-like [Trichonephila clavipes]|nr:TD and POZ domain-containing protein 1-like [Trichonephila clavipes]